MILGLSSACQNSIIATLTQHTQVEKAAVFGSRSMGTYKNGSDVDIAIYGEHITPEIVNRISVELNEIRPLPYMFDIVHYDSLENPRLRGHIDQYGRVFYEMPISKHQA